MSSWENVKRSGAFRRKVQKERDEMLKRAREVTEELRKIREQNVPKNGCRSAKKVILFRPAVIVNTPQMLMNLSRPSWPAAIAASVPCNITNGNFGEIMNSASSSAGLGV